MSKVKVSGGVVSSEDSLFDMETSLFFLYFHTVFSLCVCVVTTSYKDTSPVRAHPNDFILTK